MNKLNRDRIYTTEIINVLSPFEYDFSHNLIEISDSKAETSEINAAYNTYIEKAKQTALDRFMKYQESFGLSNQDVLTLNLDLDRPTASKIVNGVRLAPMYVLPVIVHKFFGISVDELVFGSRSRILLPPELASICRMLDQISSDKERSVQLYELADDLCSEYTKCPPKIISSKNELTDFALERIAQLKDIHGVSLRTLCNVQPYTEGLSDRLHMKREIYSTEYTSLKRFLSLVYRWGQSLDYFCSTSWDYSDLFYFSDGILTQVTDPHILRLIRLFVSLKKDDGFELLSKFTSAIIE